MSLQTCPKKTWESVIVEWGLFIAEFALVQVS